VIEWAVNLASQQARRNPRNRRERPVTPHPSPPVVPVPRGENLSSSSSSRRSQVQANQRNQARRLTHRERHPVTYPSPLNPVYQGRYQDGELQESLVSSDEIVSPLRIPELHCYLPEQVYVSSVVPTRNPQELQEFKNHCLSILISAHHQPVQRTHTLREARHLSPSPLNFQGLLWRTVIKIDNIRITEEYYWIRRRGADQTGNRAYLEPAYQVVYPWNLECWTVTRIRNSNA
jgi:hypothetical protein